MKTEIQKCLDGEIFNTSDPEIQNIIHRARALTKDYNNLVSTDNLRKQELLMDLLGSIGRNVNIDTPFFCDYGRHISIGHNVIININCTFVDCNTIQIGNNVMIASNVQIYTATHRVETYERLVEDWKETDEVPYFRTYALPVKIEDNVWIGGGVIILPGVTIGKNSVIGAGSVVTRSIPENSVAFGNPCKVIRKNSPKSESTNNINE
jgi:maltose O-acetyltransferase